MGVSGSAVLDDFTTDESADGGSDGSPAPRVGHETHGGSANHRATRLAAPDVGIGRTRGEDDERQEEEEGKWFHG